ncbi:MAG: carbon monoxide dehydrogenase, partial [Acidimicrobiales bacterium]|nr:carbon monoxide dehydrogenase [Acidimicrobiales bacterium]
YKGKAVFLEQDDANHKAVLKGDGRDTRGAGNASAIITAQAEPVSDSVTRVSVTTDLTVTGKVAQFGRGVMADVSAKLMDQFAENLEELLANEPEAGATPAAAPAAGAGPADTAAAAPTAAGTSPASSGVRKIDHAPTEAVDLLETAGAPVAKRLIPVVGVILALLVLRRIFRR